MAKLTKIFISTLIILGITACGDESSSVKSTMETATEKAGNTVHDIQNTATESLDMAKQQASDTYEAAKDKAQEMVENAKNTATESINTKLEETFDDTKNKLMGDADKKMTEQSKDKSMDEAKDKLSSLLK